MRKRLICRRLEPGDAESFHTLRLEGFRLEPRAFRFAPEDEADIALSAVASRLREDYVAGAFDARVLIGVGGLACNRGVKTQHKALIYGMYVRAAYRGCGASDAIMAALIEEAQRRVEIVTLTVVSDNARARRFYERWLSRLWRRGAFGENR